MRLSKFAAIGAALMFLAIPMLAPVVALAQEVAAVTQTVASEPTVFHQVLVVALPLLFTAIAAVSALAYLEIKKRTGIEVDAKTREALQSALENGIRWALQRAGWLPDQPVPSNALSAAVTYVENSVPDALKHFDIDPKTAAGKAMVERLLVPHLPIAGQFKVSAPK